jgi:uncharacterized protein YjbI with pentapeptide repeats
MTVEIKNLAGKVIHTHEGDMLRGADLSDANLYGANLRYADLYGIKVNENTTF